jgi:Cu-Zn family superoxide dismutase
LEPNLKKHGKWGVGEYHKGDIGNFTADASNGTITLTTDEWNIGSGDPTKDILGKGLIVHRVLMILCLNLLVMLEQE